MGLFSRSRSDLRHGYRPTSIMLAATLGLGFPVHGADVTVVGISPASPRAYEPVNLRYTFTECGVGGGARVEHAGGEFVVTMLHPVVETFPSEVCLAVEYPILVDAEVRIGTFPPGTYTVSVVSEACMPCPVVEPQRITFTVGSQPASMANKPLADHSGHWWSPSESGWGLSVHQNATDQVFVAFYHYDSFNRPTWYVASGGRWRTNFWWEGTLYRTSGPPLGGGAFDPALVTRTPVGFARLDFLNGRHYTVATPSFGRASFTYEIDGVRHTKSVERLAF